MGAAQENLVTNESEQSFEFSQTNSICIFVTSEGMILIIPPKIHIICMHVLFISILLPVKLKECKMSHNGKAEEQ